MNDINDILIENDCNLSKKYSHEGNLFENNFYFDNLHSKTDKVEYNQIEYNNNNLTLNFKKKKSDILSSSKQSNAK